jgi:hypothetical protein
MILTHESGSQEDQFDEKKWRQKISWDYPFNRRGGGGWGGESAAYV